MDITGLELFPNVSKWSIGRNKIAEIPELPLQNDFSLYNIDISNNPYLCDIEAMKYVYNNDTTNYTSIADIVTYLYLYTCYDIPDEQFNSVIGDMDLTYLHIANLNLSDYSFLEDLQDTLISFYNTGNNYVYTNDIPERLREFYLKRNATSPTPSGVSSEILCDYIKIDDDYQNVYSQTQTVLPDSVTIYGEEYGLTWSEISETDYTITYSGGRYYITISATAGESVTLYARAVYHKTGGDVDTYREEITLRTDIQYSAEAVYITEADIYTVDNDLSNIVPDMVLRYFIIDQTDTNEDGLLTTAEIENVTQLDINDGISDLNNAKHSVLNFVGINIFTNLQILNIYLANTNDFSPISSLTNLVNLEICYNQMPITDFNFLLNLDNLVVLDLNETTYSNMSFLSDSFELTTLHNVDATYSQDTVMYVKNAWAYSRTVNNLEEYADDMDGDLTAHTSTADEKSGALILNKIETDYMTTSGDELVKGFLNLSTDNNSGFGYALPSQVEYKGVTYNISWQSLTDILSISGQTLNVVSNNYKNEGGLVAKISYNNATYYRYFEVNIT